MVFHTKLNLRTIFCSDSLLQGDSLLISGYPLTQFDCWSHVLRQFLKQTCCKRRVHKGSRCKADQPLQAMLELKLWVKVLLRCMYGIWPFHSRVALACEGNVIKGLYFSEWRAIHTQHRIKCKKKQSTAGCFGNIKMTQYMQGFKNSFSKITQKSQKMADLLVILFFYIFIVVMRFSHDKSHIRQKNRG